MVRGSFELCWNEYASNLGGASIVPDGAGPARDVTSRRKHFADFSRPRPLQALGRWEFRLPAPSDVVWIAVCLTEPHGFAERAAGGSP